MTEPILDFCNRRACFSALEEYEFDVLVIGAGITGCGVARDAAMRGLRVALVDAKDIAAGTSSRSSKLVHGGLRYLAEGHITVVREAATERKTLRRIAPHLAQTTYMLLPVPSRRAMLALKSSMLAYEKLGQVEDAERYQVWSVDQVKAEEPYLKTEGLLGAIVYPEYLTEDARLTLANARSAAGSGAVVVSYAVAGEMLVENGRACGAIVRDTLPGGDGGARIRAQVVVNATGPWLDTIRKQEHPGSRDTLQVSKGIHIVLKRDRLPINHTVIMRTEDRRSIFVVPREGFAYFGTTDTFYPEAEYWPEITLTDVNYLLQPGSKFFDNGPFTYDDVGGLWAGLRPLLAQKGKKASEISRRHEILEGPGGVLSVAGGKLTSYRSMAERIVDECERKMGRKPTPSRTADEPLPGGDIDGGLDDLELKLRAKGMSDHEAKRAARLYGSEALEVFTSESDPAIEAEHAVLKEGALTLEDYWIRRSARARFDDEGGLAALEPAADRMAELLGWSDAERDRHVAECRAIRAQEMHAITGV